MVVVPLRADILDNDLTLVYIGARIGLEHGWSHVYSLSLQHELFTQLRPHAVFNDGERFVSPPPFAWLVLPLVPLGAGGATYVWLGLAIAALVAAWWVAAPQGWPVRGLWLLGALAWYPVLYGLSLAQPDLAIVFLAAVAWRLAEANRPYAAGVVLGLSLIKPQLLLLLPVVLVASGRWQIVAAWATTGALLAVLSLAVIGGQGRSDYLALLNEAQHVTNNRYFTLAFLLGPGALASIAQGVVVAAAVLGAYLNRRASHGRIFALGIVATALGTTYWHLQDYTVLVLAAWLFWRESPPAAQRWLLLVVAVAAEFAWPLTPLPILACVAAWFIVLAAPPKVAVPRPA
ncbi:MAG TPA: glycosyltransferase family 87 protein [Candidatus Dormibacteraeota bacterium]|nr:glycosyltransferase family 87 protein [Candidatus Dormibacteraeota bacterium]